MKNKSKNFQAAFNSSGFIRFIHYVHLMKASKILFVLILKAVIVMYFFYNKRKLHCHVNLNAKIPSHYVSTPDIFTYELFLSRKHLFHISDQQQKNMRSYLIPFCKLNISLLGPITVNKNKPNMKLMEAQYPEIREGGFYSPTKCRAKYKVAILVPYRNRHTNLLIFLPHMHKFMKKQLLEYQIFVVEQIDKDRFNKGALFNIGYIVSQLFGRWHCYVFHDVDLLPIDERALYSCTQQPTHLSSAVDRYGFRLPYDELFGGVTIQKPTHFESVNGYSNYYWDWGAEDDDMYSSKRMLYSAAKRYKNEGLNSIEFKLLNITRKRLFTQILTDVNPENRMIKKQYKCI